MSWKNIGKMAEPIGGVIGNYIKTPARGTGIILGGAGDWIAKQGTGGNYEDYFKSIGGTIGNVGRYAEEKPIPASGAVAATYLANKFLGNPIGGVTDAVTFGLTDFRPDESEVAPQAMQYMQGSPAGVPPLDEKQMAWEIRRLEKIAAVNNLTLNELRRIQSGGGQRYA